MAGLVFRTGLIVGIAALLAACPSPPEPGDVLVVDDDDTSPSDDDDTTLADDDDDATVPPDDDDDCAEPDDDDTTLADDDDTTMNPGPDFRLTGAFSTEVTSGSHQAASGCVLEYDLYTPAAAPTAPLVVLTHGLECGREHLADVAAHYASWGLTVVAADVCHSTVLDLDQEQNGLDVVDLAGTLAPGPVLYVGHSAGGLASFVATAADPNAVAMLGLDPAEWEGMGAAAAPGIAVPAYGLIADPNVCNGWNNALDLFDLAPQGRALRITEADHCDFSSPNTCFACLTGCGSGSNLVFSDEEISDTIVGLSTGFLQWQAGLDASGEQWWVPGEPRYEELSAAGALSEL